MVLSPIGDMAEDIMDIPELEIDPNFEPQIRARSNTWPAVRREDVLPNKNDQVSVTVTDENGECKEEGVSLPLSPTTVLAGQQKSKGSARRNAWGNSSYADLITKAIQGSPEQRLTLSQIYDWMVQNVPYFKDKGDSNSSAGWKNSIRHNLSLHNRFMRIQNEGTGKSSWWILNPDAKPGKSPRRRATSMDTKTYEKKRGRVKKKVEAMRAALEGNPSPTSTTLSESTGDLLESSTYGFQLSPDFRPRTSSNASSCGRLSPIHSTMEPDLHDNQVPSMSPIPWQTEGLSKSYSPLQDQYADHLTDSLADIVKLADSTVIDDCSGNNSLMETGVRTNSCSPTPIPQPHIIQSRNNMDQFESDSYNFVLPDYEDSFPLPPPPPYPNQINCSPPRQMINMAGGSCTMTPNMRTQSIANVNLAMAAASNPGLGCNDISDEMDLVSSSQDVVDVQQVRDCANQVPMSVNGLSRLLLQAREARLQQLQALHTQLQNVHQCQNMTLLTGLPDSSILRSALTLQKAGNRANSPNMDGNNQYAMATSNTNFMSPEQLSTQQALHPNVLDSISPFGIPQDLDFSLDTLEGIECDIEQVIKHELNVDGSLNCEFDTIDGQTSNGLVH